MYHINMTLQSEDGLGSQPCQVPALLPWIFFSAAFKHWPQFEKSLVGRNGLATLKEYWENACRLPWGRNHPAATSPNEFGTTVPTAYFIDAGEFANGSSVTVVTAGSIAAGRGNSFDKIFLVMVLPEARLVKARECDVSERLRCNVRGAASRSKGVSGSISGAKPMKTGPKIFPQQRKLMGLLCFARWPWRLRGGPKCGPGVHVKDPFLGRGHLEIVHLSGRKLHGYREPQTSVARTSHRMSRCQSWLTS